MTNRKDLPSPSSPNFLQRVREELHALLGKTGSDRDRALTLRDALETGVLVPGPGGSLVPGGGTGGGGSVEPYEPDLTPPPQPGAFTATPAISHILISQAQPAYTQGRGHGRTRVYGAQWASGPLPVFADAVEVGQFSGTVWGMPSNPATTWHLWIKWESQDGAVSATPSGGTNGVVATTGQDVSSLLDALAGQISSSELASSLATPIGQIPGIVSDLAQEAIDRAQGDAAEAAARAAALAQEAADRAAAITAEADARAAAIAAEADARALVVQQEVDARAAAIAATDTAIRSDLSDIEAAIRGDLTAADAVLASSLTASFQAGDAAALADAKAFTYSRATIDGALSGLSSTLTASITDGDAATIASAQSYTYSKAESDAAISASGNTLRTEFTAADAITLSSAQNYTYSKTEIEGAIAAESATLTTAFNAADAATLASANSYTFSKSEINSAISAMGTQLTTNFTAADAATLASAQNFTYSRSAIDSADAATLSTLRSEFAAADTTTLASAQNFTYSRATIDSAISSSASTLRAQITGGSTATDLNLLTSGLLYQMRETSAAQDAALSQQITLLSAGAGEQFDYSNIWYFDSSAEGWTANITTSTTVSAVSGWLRMAASTGTQSGRMFQSPAALGIDGAKYPQVRLRVRKVGSPTWVGRLYFITTANSTWDTAKSAVVTEPTYDANGIGLLTFNMPADWTGATIAQVRFEASTNITESAYFELDWVAVGRPSPGASSAQLQALQSAMMAGDDANAQDIITLNASLAGKADASALNALETRVTSAEGVNTSQGSSITSLQNSVTTINNTLTSKADASALNSLTTRVTTAENTITSQGGSITTLNNSLTTTNTNVTAAQTAANNAATLAGSKGKVIVQSTAPEAADRLAQNLWIDTTGGANTPKRWNGSAWVAVTDKVATDAAAAAAAAQATANTKADASALNALTTRVTTAENTITSQGSSITSLNNALTTTNNTVATKADASALSALDTRVTSAEGVNTSQGSAITSLQNSVSTINTTLTTKADTSALTALSNTVTTQGNTLTATANQANTLQARLANTRDIFTETWDDTDPLSRWQSYDGAGEPSIVTVTDGVGGKALRVGNNAGNDMRWYLHRELIPFDPNKLYRLKVRVRRTAGTGTFYLGWAGVAADGVTLVNSTGGNSYSGQHYHAVVGSSPGTAWTEYSGYTKGHGASAGTSGNGTLAAPSKMHPSVRYLRVLVLMNYQAQAGITEVGPIVIDDAEVKEIEAGLNTAIATKADASALSALSATVTNQGNTITSQGNSITALQNSLTTTNNTVATKADASALTALDTRVTATENTNTSQATSITNLTSSLATTNTNVATAQTTANNAATAAANAQTTANTASTNATTANNLLADIASDAKLTPSEKQAVRTEWNVVAAEKAGINAQAATFAITTENTDYNNAFQALANYLNNAATWSSGVPSWISDANLSTTTNIVGSTFRTNWQNLYTARTALLNAIALKAKTLADAAQATANTKADASAVTALTTRVTTAENTITSQGTAITGLQNSLTTTNNTVATKADASALNTLSTTVTNQGNTLTAQGTSITALQSQVIGGSNQVKNSEHPDGYSPLVAGATKSLLTGQTLPDGSTGSVVRIVTTAALTVRIYRCIKQNGKHSAQMWCRATAGAAPVTLDICDRSPTKTFTPSASWSFQALEGVNVDNYSFSVYNFLDIALPAGITFDIWHLQVELGDKATGWGPSGDDLYSAVQVEASTRASETGNLFAKYTVKVDVAGHVSGYGLASTANNGAVVSQFGIRADQFFVAPPATSSATAPTTNLYKGMVWVDTSVTPNVTRYYTGSAWSTTPQAMPFVVQTTPTTINGVAVPPGAYFNDAFIQNGTITNAKIANLAVDDAKIANLSVSKLTAGSIAVGQFAQSTGYVAGSSGWRINGDGTAEFSGVVVRGTIFASQGAIGGWTIGSNYLQSTTYVLGTSGTRFNSDGTGQIGGVTIYSQGLGAGSTAYDTGAGAWIGRDGRFSLRNSAGTQYLKWDGSALQISGALQAATGTFAGSLSAATGTFSGALSAATGTFSGSLTASAVNAVDTINLAGNAVTIPVSAFTSGSVNDGVSSVTLQQVTINPEANRVFIHFSCAAYRANDYSIRLEKNGSLVESGLPDTFGYTDVSTTSSPITYEVKVVRVGGEPTANTFSKRSMLALAVKR